MTDHRYEADDKIEGILDKSASNTLLRFSTAGSVDDGKSTLIGRLLNDSKNIYEDHLQAIQKISTQQDDPDASLAYLTDGLKAEREQGITIDVAYRYFSTPKRHFILADTPGHEQYTRNMATGSSTANLTILLIDARHGVITQTKRHSFIASLLGIPRFLVAINKMDLVDYSQEVYDRIKQEFLEFAHRLQVKEIRFVPISALRGDNVVERGDKMDWFSGETVMEYLENVYIGGDDNLIDFRFPVQYVSRPHLNYRGYAGQIGSGSIRQGAEVVVLPSLRRSRIKTIDVFDANNEEGEQLQVAYAPMSVTITLEDEIDISRGDMIVRANNIPKAHNLLEAMVVWMNDEPMDPEKSYLVMHTTRQTRAYIEEVKYKVNVNTLHREEGAPLELNEIGRVSITCASPLFVDSYDRNRSTGSFILIDSHSFLTVAAGMIIDRLPEEVRDEMDEEEELEKTEVVEEKNLFKAEGDVNRAAREAQYGSKARTLWLTGLSGSGKTTVAIELEKAFFAEERPVYRLDGDNLRFGLNQDLSFSDKDRTENIRRVAEVARLFNQAGITVLCSFISPFKEDRKNARSIIGEESFSEIFISTSLEECEKRDVKGLYKKARSGEIREFTGVSSPYEAPEDPDLVVDTVDREVSECADSILAWLGNRDSIS